MLNIDRNIKKFQKKEEGLYFSRFEIKFVIDENISKILQKKIDKFMEIDPFAKNFENQKYFVRSLYFDNDKFHNFNQKIDGLKIRHKFRLRTYSNIKDDSSIVFIEKKGRFNERTYKIRKKINISDLENFTLDDDKIALAKKYQNEKIINEFIFDFYKQKLKPKVLVDYYRKPYVNKYGVYFRLTFDSNLSSMGNKNNLFPTYNDTKLTIPGYEILEVKFDRTIPPWFQKIIQSFELKRLSVSKFVLGCETSNLAYDFEGR